MQTIYEVTKDEILNFLREYKKSSKNKFFSKVGLFGSFVRGDDDIYSDIDIVVKVDENALKNQDVWEYFESIRELKEEVLQKFNLKSDVFDIDSSSSFIDSIKKDIAYV